MSINIPLSGGYRILSDKNQYILAKENDDRIFHESFHSSIEDCIKEFISKKIKKFNSTSINSLVLSIKSLQTSLNKSLQPLNLVVVNKRVLNAKY
jgi:hypothetical protein